MTRGAIGFLVDASAWGGAELHTVAVARSVAARGHPVVIVQLGHDLFRSHADIPSGGLISVVSAPRGHEISLPGWRRLLREHRIRRAVLAKATFWVRWTRLDLAVILGQTPMIAIEHQYAGENPLRVRTGGLGVWRAREAAFLALHRRALRRAVAVSQAIGDCLVGDYGFDPGRVTVVANGVDPARYVPDEARRRDARARWGVADDAMVFGFLGRMSSEKRVDRLLEAFRLVRDTISGTLPVLVLIGGGPAEPELRRRAEELGIAASCRWPGVTTTPWAEYPGFDAFVLSSDREGLPYSVLEAMSCGVPVIAVDIPGARQMVMEGETGTITARTPESLAQAMHAMSHSDVAVRRVWGERARQRIRLHHDSQRAADAVAEIAIEG